MKKMKKILLSLLILCLGVASTSFAQEPSKTELENILRGFKNYRFGTISLYQIQNISEVKRAIELKQQSKSAIKIDDAILKSADPRLVKLVENQVNAGSDINGITNEILKRGLPLPQKGELDQLYNYYKAKTIGGGPKIDKVFIITSRPKKGQIPSVVIGMIVSKNPSSNLEKNLKRVGKSDVFTYDELKQFVLDSTFSANNMYDLMMNSLIQQNYELKTLEMQGIGTPGWFAPKIFGGTQSIVSNESNMTNYDIQKFLRISDEQPEDMGLKRNEFIVSPDLISWKMYKVPGYFDYDANSFVVDSFGTANADLPELGIELKYGIDDIGYNSFWSERLTALALWQSMKLGVILPTAGWSNLSTDLFEQDRKLTHAGIGIAGEFDFPFKVIPKSGLFHFGFAYVFGNAIESGYKNRDLHPDTYQYTDGDNDYLIRFNADLHYTFALQIDENYMLRFGVGGTIYNVERWYNKVVTNSETGKKEINYLNFNNQNIGGLSGKMEFMATSVATPYGASVQYFDEGLSGSIWLQIPIVKNTLSLRLDAKGYSPVFRDQKHDWEIGSYFTPMARIILVF